MNAREWLTLTNCDAVAHARELRRMGSFAPSDVATVLALRPKDVAIRVWYVAWSRPSWWGGSKTVRRAGIWIREPNGDVTEESWDVSQPVVDAIQRSASRFAQLEKRASPFSAHLDVHFESKRLVSGAPRKVSGGIAHTLAFDAKRHVREARCLDAVALLEAWWNDELLGGTPCAACPTSSRSEGSIALGSDEHSDDRALALFACAACHRRTLTLLEESRRGAEERHRGLELDPGTFDKTIVRAMRSCPARLDPHCSCTGHEQARTIARGSS